ncbi:MAG: hypothetical protein FJ221_13225 [Lentisphaerae bacterium]|nr:hypothetical protein [Lentisphaerota bacterium]
MKTTSVFVAVAAVAVTASVALAQTNVYSRNAVGAVRVDVPPAGQFVLAGFNFKAIGGDDATFSALFGTNQLVKNTLNTKATRIYLWDPAKGGGGGYWIFFQKPDGQFYNRDASTIPTNPVIRIGEGFWVQSPNDATTNTSIFIMGEVVSTQQFDRVTPNGFFMIGNPYASPLDLNGTNLTWMADGAFGHNLASQADNVYIFNGVGYDRYFLKTDGKWYVALSPFPLATNAVIPVGSGAWYKAKNVFTNKLVRPYPWW